MNSRVEALLLDYGGTIDTNGRHWATVLFSHYLETGLSLSREHFWEAYVYGERSLAVAGAIKPKDDFHAVLSAKIAYQLEWLQQRKAVDIGREEQRIISDRVEQLCYADVLHTIGKTRPVLSLYAGRMPLVLVTNFYGNIRTVLKEFEITELFTAVTESAVVGVRKPSPDIFALAAERLSLTPSAVCMVGDSFSKDILPAHSIGCHTVWLKGEGWSDEPVDETLPDGIISDLRQLPELLLC